MAPALYRQSTFTPAHFRFASRKRCESVAAPEATPHALPARIGAAKSPLNRTARAETSRNNEI